MQVEVVRISFVSGFFFLDVSLLYACHIASPNFILLLYYSIISYLVVVVVSYKLNSKHSSNFGYAFSKRYPIFQFSQFYFMSLPSKWYFLIKNLLILLVPYFFMVHTYYYVITMHPVTTFSIASFLFCCLYCLHWLYCVLPMSLLKIMLWPLSLWHKCYCFPQY